MKRLANPSHINRRPPSLHFDLADFLDLSEGKLEQELFAFFHMFPLFVIECARDPWFMTCFVVSMRKHNLWAKHKTIQRLCAVLAFCRAVNSSFMCRFGVWSVDCFTANEHDVHVQAERLKGGSLNC